MQTLKSPTFRNTGWSAIGSIANGIVGAISSAILARFLGVHDFGTLILILALLNLVTDLSDLGLNSALVKFGAQRARNGENEAFKRVASTVLRMKLLLGFVIVAVALVIFTPVVGFFFGHVDGRIGEYFTLSLVAAVILVPATFFPALLQASQSFRLYSVAMVSRYGSKLLLLLGCMGLISNWSLEQMVWVEIGSACCFLIAGFLLSPVRQFTLGARDIPLEKNILGFGKWIVLYQVISLLGGKVDVFFVGGISDAAALGLYGAAMKIAGVVSVTTYSYVSALLPEFSTLTSADAVTTHRKRSFPIVVLMIAGIGVLALISGPLIVMLFGEEYAAAAPLLQVVCIGLSLNVIGHPYSAVLFSQNKPEVFPVSSIISMLVFAGANMLLIPYLGVMGAAVAYTLHSVALLSVTIFYYRSWKRGT